MNGDEIRYLIMKPPYENNSIITNKGFADLTVIALEHKVLKFDGITQPTQKYFARLALSLRNIYFSEFFNEKFFFRILFSENFPKKFFPKFFF